MKKLTHEQIVSRLRENKRVLMVSGLYEQGYTPYTAIDYKGNFGKVHTFLVSNIDLHLLLSGFRTTSSHGYRYILVKYRGKYRYLHNVIMRPPRGCVSHHVTFSTDNRRESLMVVGSRVHFQWHRCLTRDQRVQLGFINYRETDKPRKPAKKRNNRPR